MDYQTKDSGKRYIEDSGFNRDTNDNKPRFELIIPKGVPYDKTLLYRLAMLMTRGFVKYGYRNWEKADSETALQRAEESAFRHFMQWLCGEEDEDHAAAVLFNINMAETIKHKLSENGNTN